MKRIKETLNGIDQEILVWPDQCRIPFFQYFNHDNCRIFIIHNLCHNFEWLKECKNYIRNNDYFFVILASVQKTQFAKQARAILDHLKIDRSRFIIMSSDYCGLTNYLEYDFDSILVNHNAWIDEKTFKIVSKEKIYDAILIGRNSPEKRIQLASSVDRLALVTGQRNADNIDIPAHINIDDKRLSPEEIVNIVNQSKCGLCLSAEEGACISSSEYLLCGIPIVSTRSYGGRDIWYDEYNSIICDDNKESVKIAIQDIIKRKVDPNIIRNKHIILSNYFKDIFISKTKEIFSSCNVDIDEKKYFAKVMTCDTHFIGSKVNGLSSTTAVIDFFKSDTSNTKDRYITIQQLKEVQKQKVSEGYDREIKRNPHNHWWYLRTDNTSYLRCTHPFSVASKFFKSIAPKSVLNLGDSLGGTESVYFKSLGWNSISCDHITSILKIAKEIHYIDNYLEQDAECMTLEDCSYDFVITKETLHHLPRPYSAIYEMLRIAKEGICIIEPRDGNYDFGQEPYESCGNFKFEFTLRELVKTFVAMSFTEICYRYILDPQMIIDKYGQCCEKEFIQNKDEIQKKIDDWYSDHTPEQGQLLMIFCFKNTCDNREDLEKCGFKFIKVKPNSIIKNHDH